jgi:hypothetical protein
MKTITLHDEGLTGHILNQITIQIEQERLTVRELIQLRVYKEVEHYNLHQTEYFNGLIQPTDAERVLNGYKMKERRKIDPEKQFYTALDAFQKNGFFILLDDRQAESLNEEILLNESTKVSFIRLTPLVGG